MDKPARSGDVASRVGMDQARMLHGVCLCIAVCIGACATPPGRPYPGNLLHGKRPLAVKHVDHAARATDGQTPSDGDFWLTDLSAVFHGDGAELVYDLGRVTSLTSIYLVADNNDRFVLSISDDGKDFHDLWRAFAVEGAGMRPRSVSGLKGSGRYVRITAHGGDAYVSIGELMLFARQPKPWPPTPYQHPGLNAFDEARTSAVVFAVLLAIVLGLCHRRLPLWMPMLAAICALFVGIDYARQVIEQWPPEIGLGEQLRALLSGVGALGLVLLAVFGAKLRLRGVLAVFSVLAVLGMVTFYNFGAPWFWNAEKGRLTPVHTYDTRVYFPVAKYFRELHFDGVYLASVEAYLEGKHLPDSAVAGVEMRDLHTNELARADSLMSEIHAVKKRFSPERWQSFVSDMEFFWRTMGPGQYLGSLEDHGGNATPVWLAIANLFFRNAPATERTLSLTALLDPFLMLLAFVCIARSFGLRAMLMCMLVFGTSDFPMFGSNWIGATLRFDWMATLALGVCALRTQRFALGGALLAHAGLARAFPASALLFTPVPFALHLIEQLVRKRRVETAELRAEGRGLLKLWIAALVTTLALVGFSCALFGFEPAWGGWFQKIALHTEQPNSNHIGIRTLMAFDPDLTSGALAASGARDAWGEWQRTQLETYEHRALATWALRVLFSLMCLLACRRARPEQAALIGLLLIPVFTYPANYYCHYVYLLPLLAVDQPALLAVWIEFVLVLSCALEFFTLQFIVDVRFFYEAVILLSSYLVILVPLCVRALREQREPETAPAHRPLVAT